MRYPLAKWCFSLTVHWNGKDPSESINRDNKHHLMTYFLFSRSMPVKHRDEKSEETIWHYPPTRGREESAPAILFIDYLLNIFLFILTGRSVKGLLVSLMCFLGTGRQMFLTFTVFGCKMYHLCFTVTLWRDLSTAAFMTALFLERTQRVVSLMKIEPYATIQGLLSRSSSSTLRILFLVFVRKTTPIDNMLPTYL